MKMKKIFAILLSLTIFITSVCSSTINVSANDSVEAGNEISLNDSEKVINTI